MKYHSILLIAILSFISSGVCAQDYRTSFRELMGKDDMAATLNLLSKWQKDKPNDPELYVAYYNLYAREGLKEVLKLSTEQTGRPMPELIDSTGKTAVYLSPSNNKNLEYINKGFSYIDTGIEKFPARLDMRFGKAFILAQLRDYKKFTDEIIKTIHYGSSIHNKWLWTDNKPLNDGEDFMLGSIQDYILQLYNAGDANAAYIKAISQTVLNYKPNHVESLSNLAITYFIDGDFKTALDPLLKAQKAAPKDVVVLNNIAWCYANMDDKPNALKYYNLIIKYGTEEDKAKANQQIKTLQK